MKKTGFFGSLKRRVGVSAAVVGLVGAFAVSGSSASAEPSTPDSKSQSKPTVVLVHGAFADSSSWNGVVERLQRRGYPVLAPANPLRGLESDQAYVSAVLKSVTGPIVLVGHSYGGAVISGAAKDNPQVKALVFIAAFAPETGESALELSGKFPGSKLGPDTSTPLAYPGGTELSINPANYRDVFAGDLSREAAAVGAATQRPVDVSALGAPFVGVPAWKTVPSWALVATNDNAIPAAAERFMAKRANAHTVEVKASHSVAVSRPDAVADLIQDAARG
ncbi:alpha/beta hydrolase [Amycolatopsis sp.]|uniref:alpha/beta fold hydrolase n=1 Tax=Amycolatopsis sp. TaxID=37632 RepID=UPI002E055BD5|nr:alpha/beta hydrolase [Amycolatopsis sp.]